MCLAITNLLKNKTKAKTMVKISGINCENCRLYTDTNPCWGCKRDSEKAKTMQTETLFCYGTLKMGYPLHYLLGSNSSFIAKTKVRGELFIDKNEEITRNTIPYLFIDKDNKVEGEVYEVDVPFYNYIKIVEENAGYQVAKVMADYGEVVTVFYANPTMIDKEELKAIEKY